MSLLYFGEGLCHACKRRLRFVQRRHHLSCSFASRCQSLPVCFHGLLQGIQTSWSIMLCGHLLRTCCTVQITTAVDQRANGRAGRRETALFWGPKDGLCVLRANLSILPRYFLLIPPISLFRALHFQFRALPVRSRSRSRHRSSQVASDSETVHLTNGPADAVRRCVGSKCIDLKHV